MSRQTTVDEENRTQPIILLVEEDDETRSLLRRTLQKDGYRLLLAVDEADALDRLGDGQTRADLILINLVGKTPGEVLQTGQRIREHGKYDGATPVVVLAEKYGEDLEGMDVNVGSNDWITYPAEAAQLHNLLARLTARAR